MTRFFSSPLLSLTLLMAAPAAPAADDTPFYRRAASCVAVLERDAVDMAGRYKAGDRSVKPGLVKLTEQGFAFIGRAYLRGLRKAEADKLIDEAKATQKTMAAEALVQLAWSRINKVAWNRRLHDPDSVRAYEDAHASSAIAELPLDKFLAEYTMAYSMIFMPDYGDKHQMLRHLTEAKHWFDEIPGKDDEVWRYFLHSELLKAVLDADPMFQPILASAENPKG